MKIGILVTSIGNFGQKGFYNSQEIGLAKALDTYFDYVVLYKLVSQDTRSAEKLIEGCENTYLKYIPTKSVGVNGLIHLSVLDKSLDALVYFCDTQISVPKIYKWTRKNHVLFLPYIGVLKSHSTNAAVRIIMDILFRRNLKVFRKSHCLVKTPTVEKQVSELGVKNTTVIPVGLDLSLLHQEYASIPKKEIKEKYGFKDEDKILLFIGRLIDEKEPVRMIEILNMLIEKKDKYRLLMVGIGPLKGKVDATIDKLGVRGYIRQLDRIPNSDIWELYLMADVFVNLNQQEIFGMSILEAMYYGCKVVAWKAPGPNLIIEDGVSGYLADSDEKMIEKIMNAGYRSENGKIRILNNFTWDYMAKTIEQLIRSN